MAHHVLRRAMAQLCIGVASTVLCIAALPLTTQAANPPLTVAMGDSVTLSGRDFGTVHGQAIWRSQYAWPIVDWTSTEVVVQIPFRAFGISMLTLYAPRTHALIMQTRLRIVPQSIGSTSVVPGGLLLLNVPHLHTRRGTVLWHNRYHWAIQSWNADTVIIHVPVTAQGTHRIALMIPSVSHPIAVGRVTVS